MCGYIRKSPKKEVVDGEDKNPYTKGYIEWRGLIFWRQQVIQSIDGGKIVMGESRNITNKGKEYFDASIHRLSQAHNLTKIDSELQ